MDDNNKSFFKQRKNKKVTLRLADVGEIGAIGSSSFYHNSLDFPLVSSQELKVDWSRFDRHTFFSSAAANVNVAFDKIINSFPFDGTQKNFEEFLASLTGFEKYVFDSFPKHRGQLKFSGSYISVDDAAGSLFPSLSKNKSGESLLSPDDGPYTIETFFYVPPNEVLGRQVVAQKFKDGVGITLAISSSQSAVDTVNALFVISSGTSAIKTSYPMTRGKFNHVCATLENEGDLKFLNLFIDNEQVAQSNKEKIGKISLPGTQFLIGSGVAVVTGNIGGTPQYFNPTSTLSGSLDEFRVFSGRRTINQQKQYSQKSIFSSDELKLYYKFNEPMEFMEGNNLNSIVLDSSGNSLHSSIQNFNLNLRENAATDAENPFIYEQSQLTPILFPSHPDVIDLNTQLLSSATLYDEENPNIITKLVPSHYLLEGSLFDGTSTVEGDISNSNYSGNSIPGSGKLGNVQIMLTFLYMWAKFFDEMKLYVDHFNNIKFVDYESMETVPDNFLVKFLTDFGFDHVNIFNDADIEQYVNGENIDYFISGAEFTLKNIRSQIMRRLLSNMQSIIDSKGTMHAVKSFFRSVGIDPDSTLRIREYGGPGKNFLKYSKQKKMELAPMISFVSSSGGNFTGVPSASIKTSLLKGSRVEPGYPFISNSSSDGLFTSGSWTTELQVKFPPSYNDIITTQSLCRLNLTGSAVGPGLDLGVLTNLVVVNSNSTGLMKLYAQPGHSALNSPMMMMSLNVPNFFDGTRWSIGFGRQRNDSISSMASSSYFLRVASQEAGEIRSYYATSSFFLESYDSPNSNAFSNATAVAMNADGIYIGIGHEDVKSGLYYLNKSTNPAEAIATNFQGFVSNLNFWSKAISEDEWKTHVLNPFSVGVENPVINFDYENHLSGSFERLRLSTLNDQNIVYADNTGKIELFDVSGQNTLMTGSGFIANTTASIHDAIYLKYLNPYFDENIADEKVRVYGYNDIEEINKRSWSRQGPVFEIPATERSANASINFTAEISMLDALNRDIINIMSSYDALATAIGSPELLFSSNYPDVEKIREVYFNKLIDKLNFKAFFEFYRWLDLKSFDILSSLLPKKTLFKGVNFVVESHVLERHKNQYYYSNLYLTEANKKLSSITQVLLGIVNNN
jgi:hypothetical protein